jgi:hypothetical protein
MQMVDSTTDYVPYHIWNVAEPQVLSIVQASMNSYRHELLLENLKGIPIQQQHGSDDDNVPVYHSRLMRQLLNLSGLQIKYTELQNQGHWFDGVMTTASLRAFYEKHLSGNANTSSIQDFCLVVGNPGDTGPKAGIQVTHLKIPGQYGRLCSSYNYRQSSYSFTTSNILAFTVSHGLFNPNVGTIDGQRSSYVSSNLPDDSFVLLQNSTGEWSSYDRMPPFIKRKGRQLGALNAIMRSRGPFQIYCPFDLGYEIALQISRNMYQYYAADTAILRTISNSTNTGNRISLWIDGQALPDIEYNFPIQVQPKGLRVRRDDGNESFYSRSQVSAAIFLRPLDHEKLDLVVWGVGLPGLAQAARLVPMLTGVGQPDFIILGKSASWQGVNGVLSMGFFDHMWNTTRNSFFR